MSGLTAFWNSLPASVRGTLSTLLTVALSGGSAAIGSIMLDPDHFNLSQLRHVGIVFVAGAVLGVLNWIRQQPWKSKLPNASGVGLLVLSMLGAGMLVSSCAGLNKPVDAAALRAQLADKTNRVEHAIQPLQDLEIQAERGALIVAKNQDARDTILKAHITVQQAVKKLSADVRHVAEVAVGLSTDPLPLATLIQRVTAEVQPIVDEIAGQFGASTAARTAIAASATVITAAIASIATSS